MSKIQEIAESMMASGELYCYRDVCEKFNLKPSRASSVLQQIIDASRYETEVEAVTGKAGPLRYVKVIKVHDIRNRRVTPAAPLVRRIGPLECFLYGFSRDQINA